MGLRAALVDRGRATFRAPTPRKVEGRTVMGEATTEWFRCRLSMDAGSESPDPAGTTRAVNSPTLLIAKSDEGGGSLLDSDGKCLIPAAATIEVQSRVYGTRRWQLTAEPRALRRRRSLVCFQATLTGVERDEFTPRLP